MVLSIRINLMFNLYGLSEYGEVLFCAWRNINFEIFLYFNYTANLYNCLLTVCVKICRRNLISIHVFPI